MSLSAMRVTVSQLLPKWVITGKALSENNFSAPPPVADVRSHPMDAMTDTLGAWPRCMSGSVGRSLCVKGAICYTQYHDEDDERGHRGLARVARRATGDDRARDPRLRITR